MIIKKSSPLSAGAEQSMGEEGPFFQGDIRLTPDDGYDLYSSIFRGAPSPSRSVTFDVEGSGHSGEPAATNGSQRLWPGGVVPYTVDSVLSE